MWSFLGSLITGGFVDSLKGLVTTVAGDKQARDQQAAGDQASVRSQYAAEFTGAEKRGWWNSLVDGINRLVRPTFTFGTIALFVWCAVDPIEFAQAMTSLSLVPEPLWIILGTIIVFWFGGKTLEGVRAPGVPVKTVQAVTRQLAAMQGPSPSEPPAAAAPAGAAEHDDDPPPAPATSRNPALDQWLAARSDGGA